MHGASATFPLEALEKFQMLSPPAKEWLDRLGIETPPANYISLANIATMGRALEPPQSTQELLSTTISTAGLLPGSPELFNVKFRYLMGSRSWPLGQAEYPLFLKLFVSRPINYLYLFLFLHRFVLCVLP